MAVSLIGGGKLNTNRKPTTSTILITCSGI